MSIVDDLEFLAEEELCHECCAPLNDLELEQGYVCFRCQSEWLDERISE